MDNLLGPEHHGYPMASSTKLEHRVHEKHINTHSYYLTMGKTEKTDKGPLGLL